MRWALLAAAVTAGATPVPGPATPDPFAPCLTRSVVVPCGMLDDLFAGCALAERREDARRRAVLRCEAKIIGERQAAARSATDPERRRTLLAEADALTARLIKPEVMDPTPAPTAPLFIRSDPSDAQAGPDVYSVRRCEGAIIDTQCRGAVKSDREHAPSP